MKAPRPLRDPSTTLSTNEGPFLPRAHALLSSAHAPSVERPRPSTLNSQVSVQTVLRQKAYLLFYQRHDAHPTPTSSTSATSAPSNGVDAATVEHADRLGASQVAPYHPEHVAPEPYPEPEPDPNPASQAAPQASSTSRQAALTIGGTPRVKLSSAQSRSEVRPELS